MRIPLIAICIAFITACSPRQENKETNSPAPPPVEQYRPQIHFTPASGWMNDPNGMFFLDGEYHLFYQHFPDTTVWGPMHWGHAVSKDLVHWERLPIALYPDSLGYIFSGSAVVDTNNTSGFGTKDNPPVVAIFTYHDAKAEREGKNDFQTQGIAYSTDKGRTWKKYDNNPVLKNPNIRDFRDPKVSWIDEAKQWVMTLAVKDHIEFYGSPDLKKWSKLSEFGKTDGDHGGVWECPDLFKLRDETGNTKYVLFVSINPGAPNGGSGTQYFIGGFDGKRFISDTPGKNSGWIDYGPDDYAGVTFANVPATDGRRIFIGWMSNWIYAERVPTTAWRSATTIPRTLSLHKTQNGYVVNSLPVNELDELVSESKTLNAASDIDTLNLVTKEDSLSIPLVIDASVKKSDFVLELRNDRGQKVLVGFDPVANEFYIDRGTGMPSTFHKDFLNRIRAPRIANDDTISFRAVVDVASVELFFDKGSATLTAITFPDEVFNEILMYGKSSGISAGTIQLQQLKPIW
ncbi:glycoside hydrolase family 32 protein [Chryseolinea sp. T2]|uniref:glycoside hydrolase family 32 protein n=1 Tax=Chryseolinea sp. T2 TaxID=3129255 RepID=UPI0030778A86